RAHREFSAIKFRQHRIKHFMIIQRTESCPDEQHAEEETQVTDAIDNERLFRGIVVIMIFKPETNEQIRTQAHAFPADKQQQVIAARHEQEHEKDKEIEIREEFVVSLVIVHVAH